MVHVNHNLCLLAALRFFCLLLLYRSTSSQPFSINMHQTAIFQCYVVI